MFKFNKNHDQCILTLFDTYKTKRSQFITPSFMIEFPNFKDIANSIKPSYAIMFKRYKQLRQAYTKNTDEDDYLISLFEADIMKNKMKEITTKFSQKFPEILQTYPNLDNDAYYYLKRKYERCIMRKKELDTLYSDEFVEESNTNTIHVDVSKTNMVHNEDSNTNTNSKTNLLFTACSTLLEPKGCLLGHFFQFSIWSLLSIIFFEDMLVKSFSTPLSMNEFRERTTSVFIFNK
jgi:hypothetical protein